MSSDGNGGSYLGLISNMNPAQENEVHISSEQPSTPLDLEQVGLAQERQKSSSQSVENEKTKKPASFRITCIQIGDWEINSDSTSQLFAIIHFGRKELVWEFNVLPEKLKKRILFYWSDILAINANICADKSEVLEIELERKPLFLCEIKPVQRKPQIQMKKTVDFTGGEASKGRVHVVKFLPGKLDKFYKVFLDKYPELSELSKKRIPSQISPYFQPNPNEPQYNNDAALALGREKNPSTSISVTGSSHGNEMAQFITGLRLDITMVQQGSYNQGYPNSVTGSSHGNELVQFNTCFGIDRTMVQQGNYNQIYPMSGSSHGNELVQFNTGFGIDRTMVQQGNYNQIYPMSGSSHGNELVQFNTSLGIDTTMVQQGNYNQIYPMPVTGSSHGNELVQFNTGFGIDITMFQPLDYSQDHPMKYVEQAPMMFHPDTTSSVEPLNYNHSYPMFSFDQTPMLSRPDTSVLNPQRQPDNSLDLDDKERDMLLRSFDEPVEGSDFPPENY